MSDEDINLLPYFEDAIKLTREEYLRYANGVFGYRSNCQSNTAEFNEKFYEWCQAMNCVKSLDNCKIPPYSATDIISTLSVSSTFVTQWPSTTLTYIQMINAVGHNGTCYDDYYCTQQYMAPYLHYILGTTCLVFCLLGVLSNLLFLPAFNVVSNRTGSTLYLTAMTVFDCIYMSLFAIVVVIRYMPYDYIQQLEMYSRFTAHLIPSGLPTMELMELLSVWITVALLVDRFLYLKFGFHSKLICSRKLSMQIIGTVILFLTVYTIPKYLEFHLVKYERFNIIKVMYTTIGATESFQNLLLHWLKVPVEMFLPYLAVAIFSVFNSIKLYDLMFKRKLSEASKEKKLKDENEYFERIQLAPTLVGDDVEKAQRFPSLAIESKIPMITQSLKSLEDKENAIVIVTLILGFSLIAVKVPKFVLHALKSEGYVNIESTKYFHPATDFMDLIWVAFKPLMFCVAKHFRGAVKTVFCCKGYGDGDIIQVLPMDNIASDYILKLHNSLEVQSFEESKLLDTQEGDACIKVTVDEDENKC